MTEMQSDFEDWLSINTPCCSEYNRQQIEWLMWQAWQASRAAIVVKLPDSFWSNLSELDSAQLRLLSSNEGIRYE